MVGVSENKQHSLSHTNHLFISRLHFRQNCSLIEFIVISETVLEKFYDVEKEIAHTSAFASTTVS